MKDDLVLLRKILEYCDDIENSIIFFGGDEETFYENIIFQRSCAFNILQIGELVKSLSPGLKKKHSDIRWKGISGFRDIIAHNYGKIQREELWVTITERIPELKRACEKMIAE